MLRSDRIINGNYSKEKILKKYKITPRQKKIILYAPTWKWGGGSLGECFEIFARTITKKYILVIRPHFNDSKNIRFILKWQKKYRVKDLYIFPKQYHDIIDFICISDLLIGDNSSVNYDFAITKRPMVFIKTDSEDVFIPPDKYNVKLCGPIYDPAYDDILKKIEEAFQNPIYKERTEELVRNCFYFNDGHAVDRACSFIIDTLDLMGIIDRAKVMKKFKHKFTHMNNYL